MIPQERLYTKDHEWIKIEGDEATVGITEYAQEQLGELTFVELPRVGADFEQHGELATVESSKAASDVYCPVAGRVTAVNQDLEIQPELINADCYGKGWICKLQPAANYSTEHLMDAKGYAEYLQGQGH